MQNSFLCICRKIHRYWRQIWCVVLRLLATTRTAAMIQLPILAPNFFFSSDTCQSCKEDISKTSNKSILCMYTLLPLLLPMYVLLYFFLREFEPCQIGISFLCALSAKVSEEKRRWRMALLGLSRSSSKSTHICPCDSHFRSKIQSTASPFSSLGVDVDPRGRHQGFEIIRSSLLLLLLFDYCQCLPSSSLWQFWLNGQV